MLSFILFLPLIAGLTVFFLSEERSALLKMIAYVATGMTLLGSIGLWLGFEPDLGMQYVETLSWVDALNINYKVGMDGISLWLVILTALLSCIAVGLTDVDGKKNKHFLGLLLVLETGILGVFVALDTVLFYVFWEVMLIPTYFLIGIWGEKDRIYATTKFVLFTLVGSLLMLVAIVWITMIHYEATHTLTFDIQELLHTYIPPETQFWLFIFFFLAFAIKTPLFPFHSWLPHTYSACPIPVLILLTGAMSKTGAYGFIRFCLPLFPDAVAEWGLLVGLLAVSGMIYGAWIAIAQKDIKALIAYSSISHLGFIVLGIFAHNEQGLEGSVLQMVNHGIIAAGLFTVVFIIESRIGKRDLSQFRGLKSRMPILYGMFMLIGLAALGLPGLNGFVGEFLILMGVWTSSRLADLSTIFVVLGGVAIIFASIYTLYLFQGTMQEKDSGLPKEVKDISRVEIGLLLPACILVVWIGLYPQMLIKPIGHAVQDVLHVDKTVNLPDPHSHSGGH